MILDLAGQRAADSPISARAGGDRRPVLAAIIEELRSMLIGRGAAAALAMLNARTRFRFTGLYVTAPPLLRSVRLYDRENPALHLGGACARLEDTFCALVWRGNESVTVDDAAADPSLHPRTSQGAVQSYAGVPLRSPAGCVVGTLCHFDGRPRMLPPGELLVLEAAAPLLATWLRERETAE